MSEEREMTLEEAFVNCIDMWVYICDQLPEEFYELSETEKENLIETLKHDYVGGDMHNACYFCEYAAQVDKDSLVRCCYCPGQLVQKSFRCDSPEYNYIDDPVKFLEKVQQLNEIRKAQGND